MPSWTQGKEMCRDRHRCCRRREDTFFSSDIAKRSRSSIYDRGTFWKRARRVARLQLSTQPAILGFVYFLSRFDSLKARHQYKMAEKSIYAITKFSKSIIGSQASTQSNELDCQHYAQPVLRILLECQRSPQGAPVSARLRIVWTVDRLGSHGRATQENIILVCLLSL